MVSLAVCLLNSISLLIPKPLPTYAHSYVIPFPQILHRQLDKQYLEQFEEIFVIGDVHGCYDELKELLVVSNTSDDKILKIFVGDLVNKGPKNKDVLKLVRQSESMLSVRGNHEEVVLREYFNSNKSGYQLKDENLWIKDLTEEDVNYLVELPYTISLPSLNSVVVHAGLIPGIPKEITNPTDLINMRNLVMTDYFGESSIVAIYDANSGEAWAKLWGGPEHVYFGHDANRMLQKERFATGLDTGCVYGNLLTGLFIHGKRKGELVQVKATAVHCPPKGHTIGHALTGGGGSSNEVAPAPSQAPACSVEWKQFLECTQTQSDISLCQGFNEVFRQCQQASGTLFEALIIAFQFKQTIAALKWYPWQCAF